MPTVQRIYDYTPGSAPAVLIDRLYPRGIRKEVMAQVQWWKTLAPSTELRRWYHADPAGRFDDFAARYLQELSAPPLQAELARLRAQLADHPDTLLLTAVRHPQHSHIGVLLQALGIDTAQVVWP